MAMTPEALQGQQGAGTEGQQQQVQPPQDGGQGLASEFLQSVPKDAQALLEPYVKQWDAQVTRKFQEIHSQYSPYKELGDPETIQQAMAIANALDENPQAIYDLLKEELEGQGGNGEQPPVGTEQPGQQGAPGLPPEFMERFDRNEQVLGQIAQLMLEQREQSAQAAEDSEFEEYLGELKEQYGDYDEDWVTLQISRGMDGEEAVQAWKQKEQEILNAGGTGLQTPPVLGGGGAVPQQQLQLKDIPSGQLRSLVAGMLEQSNAQGA